MNEETYWKIKADAESEDWSEIDCDNCEGTLGEHEVTCDDWECIECGEICETWDCDKCDENICEFGRCEDCDCRCGNYIGVCVCFK
jgi:hypothetical protein